jgi:molybdenum cofactor cytidylyltransferase
MDNFCSYAVVPAAGASRRMGRAKLLLPWRETTVIEAVLAAWKSSRVTATVVVARCDDHELITRCRAAGVDLLLADSPPADMKASVRLALEHVARRHAPKPHDVWLVAPADMPELSTTVIDRLLAEHEPEQPRILIPTWNSKRGHPALFPWSAAGRVSLLGADQGVDRLFAEGPSREIGCSPDAVPLDLDDPADYVRRW